MEEDIEELKELQKEMWQDSLKCNDCCASCCDCRRYNAINNVIERLKQLEEDIRILRKTNNWDIDYWKQLYDDLSNSSIPKLKVEEKIKPIITDLDNNDFGGYADRLTEVLQELGGEK